VNSRILSLDTTTEHGSLALSVNGETVGEMEIHSTEGFGHLIFGGIETLLSKCGWKLADVDAFAAAAGPGSFTGIRVGLSAVKGLAAALARPLVAVSSLQALAWYASAPSRAPFINARRDEVFGAVYSAGLEILRPETVSPLPEWLAALPDGEVELVCSPADRQLLSAFSDRFVKEAPKSLATAVGSIAHTRLAAGMAADPAAADANYVRRSDAELFWRET
jgi:tRNA threonylcarbamoyladenosine biosynthesis protein TsaB